MIVTFFRSSSFGCWSFCPMQYYLTWTLGLSPNEENGWRIPPSQKKADKGTITHKALELLACRKLAEQEGRREVIDDESGRTFRTEQLGPDEAIEAAWQHYTSLLTHWTWNATDYRDCRKWMYEALTVNGGMFSPLKRTVLWPEKRFDFIIEQPWAAYSYTLPDGRKLEGHLGIKGTIDLVCQVDGQPDTIELIDWKTGQRKDWATGQKKDFKKLRVDPQLLLYHYALTRLCPDIKHIIITIFFLRDGGPFSLPFGPEDIPVTERMLRDRFQVIRECAQPPLIGEQKSERWKCEKLCAFGMNQWQGGRKTVCRHVKDELLQLGMERVTAKYGQGNAWQSYGSGGGRSARPDKPSETSSTEST